MTKKLSDVRAINEQGAGINNDNRKSIPHATNLLLPNNFIPNVDGK